MSNSHPVTTGSAHGFTGRSAVAPAVRPLCYAAEAPCGEVRMYPEGHFEIYVGDAFERVVADQLDFLDKNLKTR